MFFSIVKVNMKTVDTFADILREAALWLEDTGKKNWEPSRFTNEIVLKENDIDELYLCLADDEPAGCLKMQTKDDVYWPHAPEGEALYIHKLAVRRRFAGRGVSKSMIGWVMKQAADRGIPFVRLDCWADRKKLCAFYESLGFSKVMEKVLFKNAPTAFYEYKVVIE